MKVVFALKLRERFGPHQLGGGDAAAGLIDTPAAGALGLGLNIQVELSSGSHALRPGLGDERFKVGNTAMMPYKRRSSPRLLLTAIACIGKRGR